MPSRPGWRRAQRQDPADGYLVALARAVATDALVSLDRDLLDAGLEDIVVQRPDAFLARLHERATERDGAR